jgi:hypothetical protein
VRPPPPRASPAGRAGGRTPGGQGTGPGPAGAQNLPLQQLGPSARGVLPGHGPGPFHRLHWYHLDVSGTIKEASGLCPERSVVGDARGYRPLPSVSRQVTRGHVSSSTDIVMHGRKGYENQAEVDGNHRCVGSAALGKHRARICEGRGTWVRGTWIPRSQVRRSWLRRRWGRPRWGQGT